MLFFKRASRSFTLRAHSSAKTLLIKLGVKCHLPSWLWVIWPCPPSCSSSHTSLAHQKDALIFASSHPTCLISFYSLKSKRSYLFWRSLSWLDQDPVLHFLIPCGRLHSLPEDLFVWYFSHSSANSENGKWLHMSCLWQCPVQCLLLNTPPETICYMPAKVSHFSTSKYSSQILLLKIHQQIQQEDKWERRHGWSEVG